MSSNLSANLSTETISPEVSSPSLFGQNMTPKSDAPDSPPEFTENQYGEMSTVRGHLDRSWTYGVVEHPEHEHHSVIHTLKDSAKKLIHKVHHHEPEMETKAPEASH
ncbi:hypothetical protein SISSUDRAFT_1036828 [Sistotremastrum suecicum HHB10207 ss-3]|uniref:Uncharacterized protein n=1 Tax=Sistotremastrum suecicum HHB10207 ss-3 TaxID=1314776 RepID=A0A165YZ04_9AGAM|nr:hypothetical protein SISSUDRAFT_1036828 [Sistotremastrum suecicum HHB10207 ss-3]